MSNVLLPMDTRRQLLRALKTRYQAASKAEKTRLLEEFILISGYHRKSAIRLLNGAVTSGNQRRRSAAARSVYSAVVQQALTYCGKLQIGCTISVSGRYCPSLFRRWRNTGISV